MATCWLLELIEAEKADRELQLQQQLQETQRQLAQSAQLLEQQKATVDKVVGLIQETNQLKAMLGHIYAEANDKMKEANAQIEAGNERTLRTTSSNLWKSRWHAS